MPISKSLSKLPSSHKILYIKHTLNKSPTKIAPLFDKNQRFEKLHSFSPNKFYNLPNSKSLRATSFGYGTKTNFANKNVIDPGNYNIPSGFAKDKKNIPSFSISRQEYYQGRSDRSLKNLAPGMYNIKTQSQNKFYMGRKLSIRQKLWPGPGQYNLDKMNSTIKKSQLVQKIKDKKMKTEYDEDCIRTSLKSFLKQTPGPGSYHIQNHHTISLISKLNMSNGFKFCKQPKLRKKEKHTNIGPGSYQIFSEFSNPQSDT